MGEILLGFFGLSWGTWVLLPFFNTFDGTVYQAFYLVAPPTVWGVVVFFIGLITFLAASTKTYLLRRTMVFLNMILWGFISLLFALTVISSTGVPIFLTLGLYSFWEYIKLTVFVGLEKEMMLKK